MKTRTLAEQARRKYHRDGLSSLVKATALYSARRPLRRLFLVPPDEVGSYASDVVRVEGRTELDIAYDGIWEHPHPSHIPTVEGRATASPRDVFVFEDATLVGPRPLIEVDGKYIEPSSIGTTGVPSNKGRRVFHDNVHITDIVTRSGAQSSPPDVDSAFLLTGYYDMYGHWSYEILPKLHAYEEYTRKRGCEPAILTKATLTSWQRESLALLGYPPDSILAGEESLSVGTLFVPSHRFLSWAHVPSYPSPRDVQWVSNRLKRNLPESDRQFGKRIYVSREDAPRRHVRNRSEVLDVLDAYGFEAYEPGRLSFADQVRLFSKADLVVGPFGAGVSNIMFAEDTSFVELVVDAANNIHHFVLANLVDVDYEYVPCRAHVEENVDSWNSDMIVDTELLYETIEQVL